MQVLFNADDFGLTKAVSKAIIQAHHNGVVSSTTLLMNGKAVDYAASLAKQVPSLDIGVHLTLTFGKPLTASTTNLTDEQGYFKWTKHFQTMEPPDLMEVKQEWRAQIEAFKQTGLTLHHLDSHHHIHGWLPLKQVIVELAVEYQVPVRCVDSLQDRPDLLLTEALWLDFYGDRVNENLFNELRKQPYSSVEVMTHPGFANEELAAVSSYTYNREKELDVLCSMTVPDWVTLL
ncbi:chitin disaccharide deacetylase [Gracilibacillus alcaliphilus]|uniref:chitin disaccharide deacetylase n=1 Tax=Gracilibacillus alcaliphilus TaxID=1401441 RepID=UPI00195B0A53|nr:chitin disaccharide deacetylase [Gracilibacillus alcaliphilus]MBM7675507.1 putative glycoside hydrolase/deacetylase ChbG (UPF0249 family) [Gracilibacillus alcaliphilus]